MNLEEYLNKLKSCPVEELTDECGIYDNFKILFDISKEDLFRYFDEREYYSLEEEEVWHGNEQRVYESIDGKLIIDVGLKMNKALTIGNVFAFREDMKGHLPQATIEHSEKQLARYKFGIIFHPLYQEETKDDRLRRFADVVIEIGEFIIENNIPACMPQADGHKYKACLGDDQDRIVYHEPK